MIAYPLSLPAIPAPQAIELGQVDVVGVSQSPFTLAQQVQQFPGQGWTAHVTWSTVVSRRKASPLLAVLAALKGPYGTILLGNPEATGPLGSGAGSPAVNGPVAARAWTLPTKGWTPGSSGVLLPGDFLQLGGGTQTRLYMCLSQVDSDSDGNAVIDIWPSIRDGYDDGDPIVLTNCKGTFRLSSGSRSFKVSASLVYATELDFVEAL